MNIEITPKALSGSIKIPPSKSISHRALICAALSKGESVITDLLGCEDIDATCSALEALGATFRTENGVTYVKGIEAPPEKAEIDCRESGSTLRFLLPVAAALGVEATFTGCGKLPTRPITPYLDEFRKHGVEFLSETMPYHIKGKLTSGVFSVPGDISSQFITGLLFALPLIEGNSTIVLTSPLQSKPYADITLQCMSAYGIETLEFNGNYSVKGIQQYKATNYTIEGDCSQAAFFAVANQIGSNIELLGANKNSLQGDRAIFDIIDKMIKIGENYSGFDVDATDIPDLVPILTVLAAFADGTSYIRGCKRLRIKESDRLESISTVLNSLGADVRIVNDELEIVGVKELTGGVCSSFNDHRIAMSLAIASQRCTDKLTITGAECVAKSYPTFFEDFRTLGGEYDVVIV
ncbi:MAG: 3-phosphoshikimate 1-carboxyvinyltransferase [Ruminococcaceae bacterium]|nr:3-phosphoshikimate 1-carboxyvinyltransferase [Oscillospiraceae bacterium]